MKTLLQYPLSLINLRLVKLANYRAQLQEAERKLAESEARRATAERQLACIEDADRKAREHSQLQPLALPLVDSGFFIKVKIDYPDIFRPNPPHYTYRHVNDLLRRHRPAIEQNVAL